MVNPDHPPGPPDDPGPHGFTLHLPGDAPSVRRALGTAMAALRRMSLGEDVNGRAEIVLAEVLNNVVEHAYADLGHGGVEVEVDRTHDALIVRVRDDGRPMPGGAIPAGDAHDLDVADDDLPEGGFGWYLIRELTVGLTYRRIGDRNELTFRLPLDAEPTGR